MSVFLFDFISFHVTMTVQTVFKMASSYRVYVSDRSNFKEKSCNQEMPGVNCSVFGCGSCCERKGNGIWKVPLAKDESHWRWREEWLGEIKKTRDVDADFREQIKKDRVYTCKILCAPEDIEICEQQLVFVVFLRVYTLEACSYAHEFILILRWVYIYANLLPFSYSCM